MGNSNTNKCDTNTVWCIYVPPAKTTFGSDDCLLPVQYKAIIWTNAVLRSIGPLGTNLCHFVFEMQTFSFNKMHLEMSSGKCQPFCVGLIVLTRQSTQVLVFKKEQFQLVLLSQSQETSQNANIFSIFNKIESVQAQTHKQLEMHGSTLSTIDND